jgi:transcriptional regulator with XRE-family HTH domain
MKTGNKIKRSRMAHQLTQQQLANLISATKREVIAWERCEQEPNERQLRRLMGALGAGVAQ